MKRSPSSLLWLAAEYHFPTTFSCRVPLSSMCSTRAMPAPGPATIRLALVRTGLELFGLERTRDELFPVIRSSEIRIQPPERVAFSMQRIRAYKWTANPSQARDQVDESIICREVAHARGPMVVYLQAPSSHADACCAMLRSVAYWGPADSLTWCIGVYPAEPREGEVAVPLRSLNTPYPIQRFFACVVSEFRDGQVEWDEVMPTLQTGKMEAIRVHVYVWPLVIAHRPGGGKVLCHHSLVERPSTEATSEGAQRSERRPDLHAHA